MSEYLADIAIGLTVGAGIVLVLVAVIRGILRGWGDDDD